MTAPLDYWQSGFSVPPSPAACGASAPARSSETPCPAYRCIGGSIVCHGRFITDAEVQAQADLAQREHDACLRIGDRRSARVARKLFLEITDAIQAQAKWQRASQRITA